MERFSAKTMTVSDQLGHSVYTHTHKHRVHATNVW